MGQRKIKQQRKIEDERERERKAQRVRRRRFKLASLALVLFVVLASASSLFWPKSDDGAHASTLTPLPYDGMEIVQVNRSAPPPSYSRTGDIDDEEITPETWRSIHLEMRKVDGTRLEVNLLRPLWWLDQVGVEVGSTIELSIPEMGAEGVAHVLSVGPCNADSRDSTLGSSIVTGKFAHEGAIVWDLYFNNNPDNHLGVTANHPLWSETRNGWVEAGHLEIGEYLRTIHGVAQLTARSQRPGRHTVYNLEVHKDHTYFVSNLGILAHNTCATPGRSGAFRNSKRDAGIPRSQQPDSVRRVPMTDRSGKPILDSNGRPIMTREYTYTRPDGSQVVIQDHSAGHSFGAPGGTGDQGSHFNVRPPDNTRNGSVPGTEPHYPFQTQGG